MPQEIETVTPAEVVEAKTLPPYDAKTFYPTLFDHWLNGRIGNFGGFQTGLFETFIKADLTNRRKLASVYPEWFATKCESVR